MQSNTKLLIFFSLLIFLTGSAFLWFGFNPQNLEQQLPSPSVLVEKSQNPVSPDATGSARLDESERTTFGLQGEKAYVAKVVDGDTIQLSNGKTVRLIGIDTPETVDPRRPVGCFGKEASNEAKSLLSDTQIILQKDVSETDKYGRLLRYIFLPLSDGRILFVNDYLVRAGFAKVLTYPPDVKYNEQFRQAEREAKEAGRGLWGRCN